MVGGTPCSLFAERSMSISGVGRGALGVGRGALMVGRGAWWAGVTRIGDIPAN